MGGLEMPQGAGAPGMAPAHAGGAAHAGCVPLQGGAARKQSQAHSCCCWSELEWRQGHSQGLRTWPDGGDAEGLSLPGEGLHPVHHCAQHRARG